MRWEKLNINCDDPDDLLQSEEGKFQQRKLDLATRLEDLMVSNEEIFLADPDTKRSLIPATEMWRFFIDGNRQKRDCDLAWYLDIDKLLDPANEKLYEYTLSELEGTGVIVNKEKWNDYLSKLAESNINKDKIILADFMRLNAGLFMFEKREPDYIKSLYGSIDHIFHCDEDYLTRKKIDDIHRSAIFKTNNTNFQDISDGRKPGTARNSRFIRFNLTSKNCSRDGLSELFAKRTDYSCVMPHPRILIRRTLGGFEYAVFPTNTLSEKNQIKAIIYKLGSIKTADEMVETLWSSIANNDGAKLTFASYVDDDRVSENLEEWADDIIEDYNIRIVGYKSTIDKLIEIITVVQDLEQLHMYNDGNCRTLVMLLLNRLLVKNGFLPCIFDDPNCFDAFSVLELVEEVINGMNNTLTLIRDKKLYGIDTASLLALVDNANTFGLSSDYFEGLFEFERQSREKYVLYDEPMYENDEKEKPNLDSHSKMNDVYDYIMLLDNDSNENLNNSDKESFSNPNLFSDTLLFKKRPRPEEAGVDKGSTDEDVDLPPTKKPRKGE